MDWKTAILEELSLVWEFAEPNIGTQSIVQVSLVEPHDFGAHFETITNLFTH